MLLKKMEMVIDTTSKEEGGGSCLRITNRTIEDGTLTPILKHYIEDGTLTKDHISSMKRFADVVLESLEKIRIEEG